MDIYAENILEHYKDPHNHGTIENADVTQTAANPLCGDHLVLYITVDNGTLSAVKFAGRGCAISQASASMLTDELIGMKIAEAKAITADDVLEMLGVEIGPTRMKCALLILDALTEALQKIS